MEIFLYVFLFFSIIKKKTISFPILKSQFLGIRGPPAEFLRTQCQTILARMLRQAAADSRRYLRNMVKTAQLHELIDFFHAFVGFCVDPSSLLSPLSK